MVEELQLQIKEIIPRTDNVKSFRAAVEEKIDFQAGQFLKVTLPNGEGLSRYLSISNSPTEESYLEFTKKLTDSDFSRKLGGLKPGDRVKISCPYGAFTFAGEYEKIAFLSGGIGITPIRSICKYVIDKKLDTDVVLIYANRTSRDIAFREDFEEMQKEYAKLKVVHILSRPEDEWEGQAGHIDDKVIMAEIPDFGERRFYLCGPPAMVEAMKGILRDKLMLPADRIVTEEFAGY